MPRHTKLGAGRKDMYYLMAKQTGYRSRAAFKLLQLNRKYNFLSTAKCLIDLCAAPGGWSQVAIQHMPVGSLVIAVDLDPIKPIPGLSAFQSDITSQHCRTELKRQLAGTPVDIVVHDGAPNVSGDYILDSFNQNVLVLYSLKLACEMLRQGGTFVSKIFRSGEHMQILYVLKQLFERVEMTKPDSSRDTSAEIFVVCNGFKGQFAQIDQQMFDPEIILQNKQKQQQQKEPSLKNLVKSLDTTSRHRDGYEDSLNRRCIDAVSFVIQQQPIQMLGKYHSVEFFIDCVNDHRFAYLREQFADGGVMEFNRRTISSLEEYGEILAMVNTEASADIKEALSDVKQISKSVLQKILVWQRKTFGAICQKVPIVEEAEEVRVDGAEVADVDELVAKQQQEIDKQRQKQVRAQNKQEKKKQLKMLRRFQDYDKDAVNDQQMNDDQQFLFQTKKETEIHKAFLDGEQFSDDAASDDEQESDPNVIPDSTLTKMEKFIFDEQDQDKYYAELDAQMNFFYQQMQLRQRRASERDYLKNVSEMQARGVPKSITERWFGQQEFKTSQLDDDQFADQFPLPRDNLLKTKRHEKRVKALQAEARRIQQEQQQLNKLKDEHALKDIEVVPTEGQVVAVEESDTDKELKIVKKPTQEDSDYYIMESSSEEELEQQTPTKPTASLQKQLNRDNIEGTATKMALAQCLLHKKRRRDLEESAYGKKFYDGDDDEMDLPDWFVQDELQNNQPQRPITADEVAEFRQQLSDLQKLPKTKKEREAIARKKMHANQRMNQAQEKIQEVINRDDLSEREKIKKLKFLQQNIEKKPQKAKQVYSNMHKTEAGFQRKVGRGTKFIDRRMKKDVRAEKAREKRYGKKVVIKGKK